ncbi:DinB family protein [Rhodohalobacter sulfatireducens]|uniref:DinB family protein n=1 Tax=Rhodohalobacter sulfatireducens TaxID=2911366 RepID=A0ABS9K9C2_9BACT|nr:DinB family protein [Rhodohalobacter sulfatireducens]MCG2587418.1 DinB family protein [Rhodohalobacter sulfatireducens]MDR9364610.1 DinB family protein [Balneolaceae bacterium]MDR9407478.1 DinB family protein [Balneolaceae bacterium]
MKYFARLVLSLFLILAFSAQTIQAQDSNQFKNQFLQHFDRASRVLALAEAMPADLYSWRPGEGVFSVEEVFSHIARYNYYYLEESLGIPAPEDVDVENMESITGKEEVVDILNHSIEHVQEHIGEMPDSKIQAETEMYGRTVNGQAVLMQLVTHKSEHVGQAIAYARVNGITPPWSE